MASFSILPWLLTFLSGTCLLPIMLSLLGIRRVGGQREEKKGRGDRCCLEEQVSGLPKPSP